MKDENKIDTEKERRASERWHDVRYFISAYIGLLVVGSIVVAFFINVVESA